jgi:hypothetical protein
LKTKGHVKKNKQINKNCRFLLSFPFIFLCFFVEFSTILFPLLPLQTTNASIKDSKTRKIRITKKFGLCFLMNSIFVRKNKKKNQRNKKLFLIPF